MTLSLYRGGSKIWGDGELLEIYNALLLGDASVAYAGHLAYARAGPFLAAVDTHAHFNRRLLELHEVIYEPAHDPPLEFRAGAANKTLEQALFDSGYLGPTPIVLDDVHWAVFEVQSLGYLEGTSNLVADLGSFGGAAARLKTLVAGTGISFDEQPESLTIASVVGQAQLNNGPEPTEGQVITLFDNDSLRRILVGYGLILTLEPEGWYSLRAKKLVSTAGGSFELLRDEADAQRVVALAAGPGVQITENANVLTLSAVAGLDNGTAPPSGSILELYDAQNDVIEQIQVGYGLTLTQDPAGWYALQANRLSSITGPVPLLIDNAQSQSVAALQAGSNVQITDNAGVLTISASQLSLQAGANVQIVDDNGTLTISASQLSLNNGAAPPSGSVLTLLDGDTVKRVLIDYGLTLTEDAGGWYVLEAKRLLGTLGTNAVPLLLNNADSQSIAALKAGSNVQITEDANVLTISASQLSLTNGALPPSGSVLTLLDGTAIKRVLIDEGLTLTEDAGGWYVLQANKLTQTSGLIPLLRDDATRVAALQPGSNIDIVDNNGVVTIDLFLGNGTAPPSGQIMRLFQDTVIRSVVFGYGLTLTQDALGWYEIEARRLAQKAGGTALVVDRADDQLVRALAAGTNISITDDDDVLTIASTLGNHAGTGEVLLDGSLKRLVAGSLIQLTSDAQEITIACTLKNAATGGAAIVVDGFIRRIAAGANIALSGTPDAITFSVSGVAQQGDLNALTTRVTTAEAKITTLEGASIILNDATEALDTRLTEAELKIVAHDTLFLTADGKFTALDNRVTATEGDISALEGTVNAAQLNITALQNDLNTAEADIDALEGRATTTETNVTALDNRLTAAETEISGHNGSFTFLNNTINRIDDDVTALTVRTVNLENTQGPWVAGKISDTGTILSSRGRYAFNMQGSFGDKRQINFPTHPAGRDFVCMMTAEFPGKPRAVVNYYAENASVCTFFVQRWDGNDFVNAFEPFSFVIW